MSSAAPLPPDAALARILARLRDVAPLPAERSPLAEALGRAPASDVLASAPLPPFDVATMDGYALRASDARRDGARLPLAYTVYAGHPVARRLPRGACARIFTGAPLPPGADAVAPQEECEATGDGVVIRCRALRGRFVRRAGSDVPRGGIAVERGEPLDAGALGLLAALGARFVRTARRPRVAILPTGDEFVATGGRLRPGAIRESNGLALAAAAWEAGAEPDLLPPVPDEPRALARGLRALRRHDVLVTVGGVSVGERDLVRGALERAGARLESWRVAMRPGKPFTFGRWGRAAVFGLPGNPASALVTFELFVRPALRTLAGLPGDGRLRLGVRLSRPVERRADSTVVVRATLETSRAGLRAIPLPTQHSGDLSSMAHVDALLVLPPGPRGLPAGAEVEALVLRAPAPDGAR